MKLILSLLFAPLFSLSQSCQDIKVIPDKALGSKNFESSDTNAVQFTKDVKGKIAVYHIHLRIILQKVDLGQKGVFILFDDGTKLEKPEETVDVNTLDKGFEFSASFILLPEEFMLFQKKKISHFKLFIYQKDLTPADGEKFRNYANCILPQKG